MKQIRKVIIAVVLLSMFIMQTSLAVDFIISPPPIEKVPDFKSRHEVIKAIPIYRVLDYDIYLYLPVHNYTANEEEYLLWLEMYDDDPDGVAGYISPVPLPYTYPMWNMAKHNTEQYFVITEEDRDYLMTEHNYADCGIMGYVVHIDDKEHGNSVMYQWYRPDNNEKKYKEKWDADHLYNNFFYIPDLSYTYEGQKFRVWSDDEVLQEINVTYPNGGEALKADTNINIKWNTLIPGGEISLFYTLDPSKGWSMIADNLSNTGSYTWKVPNSLSSTAIIEARWTYEGIDANCFDQSDKYFSVNAGSTIAEDWIVIKPLAIEVIIAPAAPTNLSVFTSDFQKQPMLFWKDNASNESSYIVERKVPNGRNYVQLAELNANTTKYIDTSAEEGKSYNYRVKAVKSTLSSGYSNVAAGSVYKIFEVLPVENKISMLFTINQLNYLVNGESKTMDVSPIILNGRTLLPVRFVADPLGAITEWKQDEKKVTVTLDSIKLELWINNNTALVNGESMLIDPNNPDVKPIIVNNRTMLPMRFIAEKLGCDVEWIPENSQVQIDKFNTQP